MKRETVEALAWFNACPVVEGGGGIERWTMRARCKAPVLGAVTLDGPSRRGREAVCEESGQKMSGGDQVGSGQKNGDLQSASRAPVTVRPSAVV